MPAVSKKQQRFFGMVRAAQKGEGAASPEVAKVASEIKKKDAKDFASTKHKGLPMKKEETVFEGDVHSGQGEKIQSRTKKYMDKKGMKGAPGLDAMKARTAEHEAKRGVKEELTFEGWKDKAGDAIKKVMKKKDTPKHDYGKDAGAEAAKRLRKKDHENVNYIDPDD